MTSGDVDRGYAWVVLTASFLLHMITYGLAWSTGVYNVIFLDAFGQPKAVTAWAGALPTAMMYAIGNLSNIAVLIFVPGGPIASMFTNKYGFRPVIMVGGIMASSGLCLSYFAPNIYYLFFTFGVVTGAVFDMTGSYTMAFLLGGGMCICAGLVMIQPYLYVKRHEDIDAADIAAEKTALSEDSDVDFDHYKSHRDLVQMTVSLESLSAAKRALDNQRAAKRSTCSLNTHKQDQLNVSDKLKKGKIYRPIHKDVLALKCTYSTETI